jgi:hypothetical protein
LLFRVKGNAVVCVLWLCLPSDALPPFSNGPLKLLLLHSKIKTQNSEIRAPIRVRPCSSVQVRVHPH